MCDSHIWNWLNCPLYIIKTMSYINSLKPKPRKQVWTPLKKPPHPGVVHILSDDALLVLSALREAHWKKMENQQRKCQKSADARSYYTQIYAQSFKTEKLDTASEDRSSVSSTQVPPGPRTIQRDISQSLGKPTDCHCESESTETNPAMALDLISAVKTEPEESLPCNKIHNLTDSGRESDEFGPQIPKLPNQVLSKHEINEAQKQEIQLDADHYSRMRPSDNRASSPKLHVHALSYLPSISISSPPLQNLISDASQGSRTSLRAHPPLVSTPSSADEVEKREGHATLPTFQTILNMQSMICNTSNGSEIISSGNHLQGKRCLLSAEDVEELDNNTIYLPPSLQQLTDTASSPSRVVSQATSTFSRACPLPGSRHLPSGEDVEGLGDCRMLHDRPRDLSVPCRTDTDRTVDVYPDDTTDLHAYQTKKSLPGNHSSVPTESSAVDVEQLSCKAGTLGSQQDLKNSKTSKRKCVAISSKNSNDTPSAVKKRIIPTFHTKVSGLKVKSKNKQEALAQMSIEQVMGTCISKGASQAVKSVTSMAPSELVKLRGVISEAEEILMMLMYTDGSTQLRELDEPKKRASAPPHEDGVANSVLVAIPHKAKEYTFVSFPLLGLGKENASEETRNVLLEILQSSVRKVCFDAQEMVHAIIINYRLDPQTGCNKWMVMDPKVACWLLDPDNPPVTFTEILKKFLPGKYNLTTNSQLKDLELLGPVMRDLTNRLETNGLLELFINLEVPLIPILAGMEVQGIQVNQKMLISYSNVLKDEIRKIERRCYKEAGHPFQITSHAQLRQVLFDELKLDEQCPGQKLARTNVQNLKSTSETVLHKLKRLHPLPKLVLNHRQLVKLKSTYIDGLSDYVSGGYIHTSWEQTSAASGRLQSANPNIQNIPKQPFHLHEETKGSGADETNASTTGSAATLWMREPFVSHEGWSFVAADFQSIELRILAHLSQDAVLLKVFNDAGSTDIFVQLTCEWLGLNPEDVKTSDRERTKRIVYSVIYGVGAERLAETLHDTKENAKAFTKSFLGKFKGVNAFAHRCISECQRHGDVKTIFNRHRLISNIKSQNFHVRSHAERQAVNFVIQGSAADICKLAMIHIMKVLSKITLRARLLVQIHDELLFEVHDEDIDEVKGLLKNVMESTPKLGDSLCQMKVPLPVSVSYGKTWGHLVSV